MDQCPFCSPHEDEIIYESDLVFGILDAYPVSKGHCLFVTKRHTSRWSEATMQETVELLAAIEHCVGVLGITSYNVGTNVGEAAGQTVPHMHLHLIPRVAGDTPNPRGGIRNVIAGRGDYQ